jgi:hypothetical protein
MSEDILDNPAPNAGPSDAPSNITDTPPSDVTATQTWPDQWRQELSGGDEKLMKQLERFNGVPDLHKSYLELQTKFSSQSKVINKPGEDATPEQWSEYRESIGVPETSEGYNLDFEDGTVIGEDFQPQVDDYLKFAHESNVPPELVKSTIAWQMNNIQAQQEALKTANDEARIEGTAELRSEWGGEFQGNINAVHSLFTEAPEGTMERLFSGVGEDGLKFANNPDNIRWLVNLAKQVNPTATLVPPGPDQAGSIDAEIEKIQKIMNSPDKSESDKYWKDDAMQARFVKLNQAKQSR